MDKEKLLNKLLTQLSLVYFYQDIDMDYVIKHLDENFERTITNPTYNQLDLNSLSKLSDIEIKEIRNAVEKTLQDSNLKSKNVKVEYLEQIKDKKGTFIQKYLMPISSVKHGNNAFFLGNNTIMMPEKDIPFAVFHEMGHADRQAKLLAWIWCGLRVLFCDLSLVFGSLSNGFFGIGEGGLVGRSACRLVGTFTSAGVARRTCVSWIPRDL